MRKVRANGRSAVALTLASMVMPVTLAMCAAVISSIGGGDAKVGFAMGSCFAATSVGLAAKVVIVHAPPPYTLRFLSVSNLGAYV